MNRPFELVLYISTGCCLCHELRGQIEKLRGEFGFTLEEVDITGIPELEARYGTELPVLMIDGRKAVKCRISTAGLRQRLQAARGTPVAGCRWLR